MSSGFGASSRIQTFPSPHPQPARPLRRIFVRDLELNARIGIYEHEHGVEQKVRINMDARVYDQDVPQHDSIDEVVSYEDFVLGARKIVASGHINLVETLAERLAEICLTDERVHSVTVRVEKLDAFDDAASVGVEIDRFNPAL